MSNKLAMCTLGKLLGESISIYHNDIKWKTINLISTNSYLLEISDLINNGHALFFLPFDLTLANLLLIDH